MGRIRKYEQRVILGWRVGIYRGEYLGILGYLEIVGNDDRGNVSQSIFVYSDIYSTSVYRT